MRSHPNADMTQTDRHWLMIQHLLDYPPLVELAEQIMTSICSATNAGAPRLTDD